MTLILVVDDTAMDRKRAESFLTKHHDWQVVTAHNGLAALEQISELSPHVVITDLQMPEMNGIELVQHLTQRHPDLPVVVMTSQGNEAVAVEALQNGAAGYVPKKELHRLLVQTVMRVLISAEETHTQQELMRSLESVSWSFSVGNDPSILASLVAHLQSEVSRTCLLPESECFRCGVAFEEALLNAAYHGNLEVSSSLREENPEEFYELARKRNQIDPYRYRKIMVDVRINADGIEYVIQDEGPGFDLSRVPDPTDEEHLDRASGRGILLMKTFMDEVNYNDRGNCVTMIKHPMVDASTASFVDTVN